MADGYDRAQGAAKDPQGHIMAQRLKILAGTGAIANAVDPNPLVGLMDMALMVTLTRQIAQDPWAGEVFGPESAQAILATLKEQEANAWRLAGSYLTPPQIQELRDLALAERVFFDLRHMLIMTSWQADALYEQMLAPPRGAAWRREDQGKRPLSRSASATRLIAIVYAAVR
jgi:hypothetical protein